MLRVLDVALGLALVFTLVSFAVSLLTEWLSALWGQRSRLLHKALLQMLGTVKGAEVGDHPLVQSLVPRRWLACPKGPSYLPTDLFVTTLVAVLDPQGEGTRSQSSLLERLKSLPADDLVRQTLTPLVEQAGDDWAAVKKSLGDWFDRVMDEVTAWYRRWSQLVLFLAGFALAAVVGVDALDITRTLWVDTEVRQGISAIATDFAKEGLEGSETTGTQGAQQAAGYDFELTMQKARDLQELQKELAQVGLTFRPIFHCTDFPDLFWCLLGYLLTGLAASLGAGFWFDLLKRLVQIRTSIRPQPAPQPPAASAGEPAKTS